MALYCNERNRGLKQHLPEHLAELLQLLVGYLSADGLQPFGHEALPQGLADDIVGDQTEDAVQALLQLGHRATRLVPVTTDLGTGAPTFRGTEGDLNAQKRCPSRTA